LLEAADRQLRRAKDAGKDGWGADRFSVRSVQPHRRNAARL